jgi:hypothetical protein
VLNAVALLRWAAWAPGIASEIDWRAWARDPRPPVGDDAPPVGFLPAMQRRRCDTLSRMMLEVAHRCCEEQPSAEVACVFASRHGSFATTISLLQDLARDAPLSPARFSHSVHNTQAGLFSIWARNSLPSVSLAAGAETFAHGFLEAVGLLHREPGRPVLFVSGDETAPGPVAELADPALAPHALGLLLAGEGGGAPLRLGLEACQTEAKPERWPDALEFVRWWLSEETSLRIARPPRAWTWTRGRV